MSARPAGSSSKNLHYRLARREGLGAANFGTRCARRCCDKRPASLSTLRRADRVLAFISAINRASPMALESPHRSWYDPSSPLANRVEQEDPMSRHAGNFTAGVLAGAVFLAGLSRSALAQDASPPVFTPNPSAGWFAYSRVFIPPAS